MNTKEQIQAILRIDVAVFAMLEHRMPSERDHQKADEHLLYVVEYLCKQLGLDDEAAAIRREYESIPKWYA